MNNMVSLIDTFAKLRRDAEYTRLMTSDVSIEYFDTFRHELKYADDKKDVLDSMACVLNRYGMMSDIALHFAASLCTELERAEALLNEYAKSVKENT
jgi:hypothetical protein